MIDLARKMFHPSRLTALTIFVAVALSTHAWAQIPSADGDLRRLGSVFDPQPDGGALEHETVADPASLDGAAAERIYRAILPQMQVGYAASGDPLAWAYVRWQRYNTVPYRSHRHGGIFVNNYANDIAAGYGRLDEIDALPVGSLIVKDSFVVTETGDIRAGSLAIMEKMPAGYDPVNGDWRYLVIGPAGSVTGVAVADGADPRMTRCAACHNAAPKGQDRLFHVPREVRR